MSGRRWIYRREVGVIYPGMGDGNESIQCMGNYTSLTRVMWGCVLFLCVFCTGEPRIAGRAYSGVFWPVFGGFLLIMAYINAFCITIIIYTHTPYTHSTYQ